MEKYDRKEKDVNIGCVHEQNTAEDFGEAM